MSSAASAADWLRSGGIGVGVWAVYAVLAKAGLDSTTSGHTSPPATAATPERTAPAVPPRPIYPPSTARHAAGPATASTSPTRVQPYLARHSKGPAWT